MVGEDKPLSIDSKVDRARLSPCRDSLLSHFQRVNYRASCYKKAYFPIFEPPKPYDKIKSGYVVKYILQNHSKGSVIPQSVIDQLDTDNNDEEETYGEIKLGVSYDYKADDDKMEYQQKPISILIF